MLNSKSVQTVKEGGPCHVAVAANQQNSCQSTKNNPFLHHKYFFITCYITLVTSYSQKKKMSFGGLKPVLLMQNLTLNFDAAPNYKHIFSQHRVPQMHRHTDWLMGRWIGYYSPFFQEMRNKKDHQILFKIR